MNEKVASIIQKAQQERTRAQFGKALKRLEQGIASHPDELDLYLEAIDTALEGGEMLPATNLLKIAQDKFVREKERVLAFVRDKLITVHDASLARCVIEHLVKRRDLESALALLDHVPEHTIRELLNRARTKAQSLKSASHGGYELRGEAVANELVNAMLSVRLGNVKEATTTFVKVVEERPAEHKTMEPFLVVLSTKHAKSGRIRWARGCVHRVAGNEVEAIQQFVDGARLDPACAASCVEQLRAMLEKPRYPSKIRRALAETQLLKGDAADAVATLRDYLVENPENAREVIMLVRPFIESSNGLNECTWLAVEQALGIEQSSIALEILRGLHQRGSHGPELFAWLEERAAAGFLPADVMIFHASLALDQKHFARAAEILSGVCSTSSQDIPAVLSMIDRHRAAHPALDELYRKHAGADATPDAADANDDGDFQTFESNEFRLETSGRSAPAPSKPAAGPKPRFSSSPFSSGNDAGRNGTPRRGFLEANELSFDDDGAVQRADGDEPMKSSDPVDITEAHVTNVAQQLYLAGAAAFFHIDDATDSGGEAPGAAPSPAATPAASAATTPPAAATFEERYQMFSRGELSNADVLVLLEEAAHDARSDELHELLYFEPQTGEEHFARYYYQAEYHVLCNRPLQALEILAKLDTPDLAPDRQLRIGYKIAVAQRMAHNYAGAGETLDRLVRQFPGRDDLIRLKKRNHEQFIESQSMAATTLEKTASLD